MTDDLDEFSTPIGTGMTRCPTVPLRDEDGTWDDVLALCDEVDRLRAAIAAIPRHRPGSAPRGAWLGQWTGMCGNCRIAWPCPTEQAHRLLEADRG